MNNQQDFNEPSFIEAARRAQIMGATIETLADLGYSRTSLAQIARRARISTSLISYHFKDKDALIFQTLLEIAMAWETEVWRTVGEDGDPRERLRRYIVASLAYMGTRPQHYAALLEIVFNARDEQGTPLYRLDDEDTMVTRLKALLAAGQAQGAFGRFDLHHTALAVRGVIDAFFTEMYRPTADLEAYTTSAVSLCMRMVAAATPDGL